MRRQPGSCIAPLPESHIRPPAPQGQAQRYRARLRSWLFLCLAVWVGAMLGGASGDPPPATPPLPPKPLFDRNAPAQEAPRWQTTGGGIVDVGQGATGVIGGEIGLNVVLPAQADAAAFRDLPADCQDWSAYPSLQLEAAGETPAHLQLILTDSAGKQYSQAIDFKSGHNRKQVQLKVIAAQIDAAHITRLTLATPAPTAEAPLTARRFRLLQLTLGPELSGMAEEIQNAWYFYYLSHYGYFAFFLILMAISFGVPLPEEIFHLSAGYLAYLTKTQPEIGINVHIIAPVNMFSTLVGDIFIYYLGRTKGEKIRKWRWFRWVMPDAAFVKVREWFDRWGVGATFMFRFLPPIRMPGYFAGGLLRQSPWTFIAADGLACLISVPTQIYLVYFYGDWIIAKIKDANFLIAVVAGILVLVFAVYKLATRKKRLAERAAAEALMHSPEAEAAVLGHNSATGIPILDGADATHIHIKHLHQKSSGENPETPPAPAAADPKPPPPAGPAGS